jgi:multicomponent K+:H+ antiporter subunit A
MPSALWLIALPVGAAPLVYLFRRVGVGAIVAALVAFLSAWLAIRLPTGLILNFLGRSIELGRLSQAILALLFATTAVLFLISSVSVPFISGVRRRTIEADVLRGTGRTFYPVSLGILGLLVAATLSHHLGITAIFVEAAAILAVFIIQGSRLEATRAAQRFLVLISLSIPLFLLAAWRIDLYQLTDGLQPTRSIEQTALLVGLGFALWLAVVPFHSWSTTTATETSPTSAAFILIVFPAVAFLTLIQLLADAPWLINTSQLIWAMLVAGIVTACVGGLLTSLQRGYGGLLGYAALYDLGCTLLLLGVGGQTAVITVLGGLTARALALTLIAGSISAIRLQISSDGFVQARGLAQRLPLATAGLMVGGLTLAGSPLTLGFALRWQLIQMIAAIDPRWPALLILAGLGVAIGYLRGVAALLTSSSLPASSPRGSPQLFASEEPLLLMVILIVLGLACLLLGVFPGWLIEPLRAATIEIFLP